MAVDVEPQVLSAESQRAYGFTHKVNIKYTDLTAKAGASDTTATLAILDVIAGTMVDKIAINLITAFDASDASINSLTAQVGDGSDTDRFLAAQQCAVDGTEISFFTPTAGFETMPYAYTAADTVDVLFTVAGGGDPTIDELTSGEVEIYFNAVDLNKLEER